MVFIGVVSIRASKLPKARKAILPSSPPTSVVQTLSSPRFQVPLMPSELFARRSLLGLLDRLQDSVQVVGLRGLQRRERLIRHEFLFPELLADGQHVPVVDIRSGRGRQRALNVCVRLPW